jgi:hypothetical protein
MCEKFLKVRLAALSGESLFLAVGGNDVPSAFSSKPARRNDLRHRIGSQPPQTYPTTFIIYTFLTFFQNYLKFSEKYAIMLYRGTKKFYYITRRNDV